MTLAQIPVGTLVRVIGYDADCVVVRHMPANHYRASDCVALRTVCGKWETAARVVDVRRAA